MFKALIRYLLLSISGFVDGLLIIIFDRVEIQSVNTAYGVKPIAKSPTEEQKILVKYLEKCRKKLLRAKMEQKTQKKEPKKDPKKKLTPKQIKFCKEYVLSLNGTQAALKAGYSKDTAYSIACENLKKPEIKEYIAALRKDEEDQFYYSRTMSFKKLEEAQKLALERIIIKVDKSGEVCETPSPDIPAFLKAEELKGKMSGLYEPEIRQEININSMGSVKINGKELQLKIGKKPTVEEE